MANYKSKYTGAQIDAHLDKVDTNEATITALSSQIDNKQAQLVSGTNIKTINNQSILGSGNIEISGGGSNTLEITTNLLTATTIPQNEYGALVQHALSGKSIVSWKVGGTPVYAYYTNYQVVDGTTPQFDLICTLESIVRIIRLYKDLRVERVDVGTPITIDTDLLTASHLASTDLEKIALALGDNTYNILRFTSKQFFHNAYYLNSNEDAGASCSNYLTAGGDNFVKIKINWNDFSLTRESISGSSKCRMSVHLLSDIEVLGVVALYDATTLTNQLLLQLGNVFGKATTLDELKNNANNKVATGQMTFVEMLGWFTYFMASIAQPYYYSDNQFKTYYFLETDTTKGGYLSNNGVIKDLATFLKEIGITETTIKGITIE